MMFVLVAIALLAIGHGTAGLAGNDAVGNDAVGNDAQLSIGVQDGAGQVTVSVTEDGTPAENATLAVDASDWDVNDTTTDEDGIATFDKPTTDVTATFEATTANASATKTVDISGSNGTGPDFTPQGQIISSTVQSLQDTPLGEPLGQILSALELMGPPDHAGADGDIGGPTDDAGPQDHAGPDGDAGPPDHAGPDDDNGGPPDHAGPPDDDDDEDDDDDDDDEEDDENGNGPPDHANN